MKPIKVSQVKELLQDFRDKVKEKLDKAFIDANYVKDTQKITLTPINGANKEVVLTDLASKTLDNTFEGNNTFKDFSLGLSDIANMAIPDGGHLAGAIHLIKTGNREVCSHANQSNGYVKNLVFRVDNKNIGDNIRVNVWEVTKGVTRNLDTPKLLHSDITLEAVDTSNYWGGGAVGVKCPINKKYSNDTYFIYETLETNTLFRRANITTPKDEYIFIDQNTLVSRESIANSTGSVVGIHLLELGNVSIGDLIPRGGNGTVTSVNGQTPNDQGEVTVEIADIQGLQGQLDGKVNTSLVGNDANKIPVLDRNGKLENSIIPDLAITDVFVVANENEMMQKTVQVGDVVVVENEGNKTYMCKDPLQQDKINRFIEINMGTPMVMKVNNISPSATGELDIKGNQIPVSNTIATSISEELDKCVRTVNGQQPLLQGDVTINAGQILAVVGNQAPNNVQTHLNNLHTKIENHTTRIGTLESKKPTIHVGEIITTFEDKGNSYRLNGVEYIYLGRQNNTINSANYRELTRAFGLPDTTRAFDLPYIQDVSTNFNFGNTRNRKTYIVAKIN